MATNSWQDSSDLCNNLRDFQKRPDNEPAIYRLIPARQIQQTRLPNVPRVVADISDYATVIAFGRFV